MKLSDERRDTLSFVEDSLGVTDHGKRSWSEFSLDAKGPKAEELYREALPFSGLADEQEVIVVTAGSPSCWLSSFHGGVWAHFFLCHADFPDYLIFE